MENQNTVVYKYSDYLHEIQTKAAMESAGTKINVDFLTSIEAQKIRGASFYYVSLFFAIQAIAIILFFVYKMNIFLVLAGIGTIILSAVYIFLVIKKLNRKTEYALKMNRIFLRRIYLNNIIFSLIIFSAVLFILLGNDYLKSIESLFMSKVYIFHDRKILLFEIFLTLLINNGILYLLTAYFTNIAESRISKNETVYENYSEEAKYQKWQKLNNYQITDREIKDEYIHNAYFDTRHVIITGSTGSGKTTILNRIMQDRKQIKARNVYFDQSGEILKAFYKQGDVIFDITDERSVVWNFLKDVENAASMEEVAKYLIPTIAGETNPFFRLNARAKLADGMIKLWANNKRDNAYFIKLCENVRESLNIDVETDNKDAINTLQTQIRNLKYINTKGEEFSLKNWLRNQNDRRNIFVKVNLALSAVQEPFLTLFLATIQAEILNPAFRNQERINIYIDEFNNIQTIENLGRTLSLSRKFNVAFFLAMQSLLDAKNRYGNNFNQLIENCNNRYNFLTNDPANAKIISEQYGNSKIKEAMIGFSGTAEAHNNASMSEQKTVEERVPVSTLTNLGIGEYFAEFLTLKGKKFIDRHKTAFLDMKAVSNIEFYIPRRDWASENIKVDADPKIIKSDEIENKIKNILIEESKLWKI